MTITSSLSRMPAQAGNGVTTAFPYTFKILDEDDILVVLKESDGTETEQLKTTHYTVSGVGDLGGGSVNFITTPPTGVEVHLVLDPSFTQLVDYQADEYENAFDRATLQNKRVKDIAERSIRVSEASGVSGADLNLVPAANSVIGWDENSQIESKVLADLGEITSVTSPLSLNGNVLSLNDTIPQNKTDATLAPTINNDSSQGYSFLSRWGGPPLDDVWVCIDATVGAAVWKLTTGALAGLDTVDTDEFEDNALTLAKLEHGTTGDILYYGASGEPFRLAKGADDQVLKLNSGLPSWGDAPGSPLMHVTEEQANNVAPTTITANSYTPRELNTIVTNAIGGSVSSKRVSLAAGTYYFEGLGNQQSGSAGRLQLYNYTDSLVIRTGVGTYANGSYGGSGNPTVRGKFTIAGTKEVELRQRNANTSAGAQTKSNHGIAEVYAELLIWKVA